MDRLTPDALVDWSVAICLALLFVSCGVGALLGVVR
jgi:hypothetical protein